MVNLYFSASSYTPLARITTARAEALDTILAAIVTGFDLLPTPTDIDKQTITFVATDTGVANAYVISQTYVPLTYTDGMEIVFRVGTINSGASTVNVNSIGVTGLRNYAGSAFTGGELLSGAIVVARYDANNAYFRVINPNVTNTGAVTVSSNVRASLADIVPGTLNEKQTATASWGLKRTLLNGGANEQWTWALDLSGNLSAITSLLDADLLVAFQASSGLPKKFTIASLLQNADILALEGARTADLAAGTTAMTANRRYRITGTATATLPTYAADQWNIVEFGATSLVQTVGRNAQTIDAVAADDTCSSYGPIVLYRCTSAGVVVSKLIGRLPA